MDPGSSRRWGTVVLSTAEPLLVITRPDESIIPARSMDIRKKERVRRKGTGCAIVTPSFHTEALWTLVMPWMLYPPEDKVQLHFHQIIRTLPSLALFYHHLIIVGLLRCCSALMGGLQSVDHSLFHTPPFRFVSAVYVAVFLVLINLIYQGFALYLCLDTV